MLFWFVMGCGWLKINNVILLVCLSIILKVLNLSNAKFFRNLSQYLSLKAGLINKKLADNLSAFLSINLKKL